MNDGANLNHLADIAGVEPEYWDIWGNHHPIPAAAKKSILAALGLAVADDEAIARSMQQLQDAQWRRWLPPVLVATVGETLTIPLSLPADRIDWPVTFEIVTESGESSELVFRPGDVRASSRGWIDGREILRFDVPVTDPLPMGYHDVRLAARPDEPMRLIVAPHRCYLPQELERNAAVWGISAQLYSLKRPENWGIGDFTDLAQLVDLAATLGASVIGLNPLHALFLGRPQDASPYSPSSRIFLNPLYIDVEAVPEFAICPEVADEMAAIAETLAACRARSEVAYRDVQSMKLRVLGVLYAHFLRTAEDSAATRQRHAAFNAFREQHGEALRRYAIFEALSEQFAPDPWQSWPEAYHNPDSPEVSEFVRTNTGRIGFFEYLQWVADAQLGAAQERALQQGLCIGIYRDLAVGADRAGADAWSDQSVIVQGAKVGCPPDPFNMLGQDWGIPPLHPLVMRAKGYKPFIDMLRANMRHAGGLRIDHVMGLMHLFWIPAHGAPADGAYVKYPFDEMLAILALESQRNRCLVVGEDLGTVPDGFRERMADLNILSYRVLYFEKEGDRFKRPDEYPSMALACVTTHDLATLIGYWQGADIDLKRRLELYPSADAELGERGARVHDRWLMLTALAGEGLLPPDHDPNNVDATPMGPELIAALHSYLARSPSRILLVQIDDLTQEVDQINLPGTVFERPNWRRRLSQPVSEVSGGPVMGALAPALAERSAR